MSHGHGLTPRHCWAIPPNRCCSSRGGGGYWDFEKDLLEGFSSDSRTTKVRSSCWDSEKDLLEVFSTDCPASEVPSGLPSHQILQQEARSNSCVSNARRSFPNASTSAPSSSCPHHDVHMTCQRHQPLSWHPYDSALRHLHIHHCSTLSQLPWEMPQEAWWAGWIWGPGMKRTRGCERFLAFMVVAAMSVLAPGLSHITRRKVTSPNGNARWRKVTSQGGKSHHFLTIPMAQRHPTENQKVTKSSRDIAHSEIFVDFRKKFAPNTNGTACAI